VKPLLVVSGIKNIEQAMEAVTIGAVAIGFVFHGEDSIHPEQAREIALSLPPFISRVGIFKDEPWYSVMELATLCSLEVLMFEGTEDEVYLGRFSQHVLKYGSEQADNFYTVMGISQWRQEMDSGRLIVRCHDVNSINKAQKVITPFGIELRTSSGEDYRKLLVGWQR